MEKPLILPLLLFLLQGKVVEGLDDVLRVECRVVE
jgi:hypothetical protein